jgi:hypothetical protein
MRYPDGEPPIETILTDTLRVGVASALAEWGTWSKVRLLCVLCSVSFREDVTKDAD